MAVGIGGAIQGSTISARTRPRSRRSGRWSSVSPRRRDAPRVEKDDGRSSGVRIDQGRGRAMSVEVGDKAPDFTLPADNGGKASLTALKGKPVVLYFYP